MTTAPPSSPVDICNLALDYIGEAPINTIDDPNNDREETLARWYDHSRQIVLREYLWNFAHVYTTLPQAGAGEGTYTYKYLKPNDCVRVKSLGKYLDDPIQDYEISEGYIHCDGGTSLPIRYTKDVTTVSMMDSLFVNILALRIASKVAFKFTKKRSVEEKVLTMLATEEGKATSVDGQERPPRRVERSKYRTARIQGGTLSRNNKYYDFSNA